METITAKDGVTYPVVPGIKAFLDKLNSVPPVDPAAVAVDARRKLFAGFAATFAGEPAAVASVEEISIPVGCAPGSDAPASATLRVYTPHSAPPAGDEGRAFLLYAHGGGWHAGSLDTHDGILRHVAASSGAIVGHLDYRLAPEHPAPAAVADVVAGYAWAVTNAPGRWGVASTRVALGGDSAGGNIVTAAGLVLTGGVPAAELALPDSVAEAVAARTLPPPAALLLIYPSLDLTCSTGPSYTTFAEGFYLRMPSIAHYVRIYLEGLGDAEGTCANPLPPSHPLVSPILAPEAALAALPHTVIITAALDPLLSDGIALHAKRTAAGAASSYTEMPGMIHAGLHLLSTVPEASAEARRIGGALAAALGLGSRE